MADKLFPTFILNKIKQFICFFLFVPAFIIAQNSATGIIKDTNNIPIEGANVIIKTIDTDNIIAYGNSNNNGIFSININSGNYNLKISFLGYKTVVKPIEVKDKNLDLKIITLIKDNTELDEVILKAETNGIIQKGDTTQYKIDKFLNGTEANLKDVIDKLPGININDKGKITANGKEIDRLLIDGENLYKRQHQLATENVSSEMIKNIELIRNYKDFESIQQNNKTSTTALNVTIKNDFKNKFTGNIEIQRGIKNKYKLNLPVFNFNKKVKFSLITNLNNLGESPINIEDYFSLINSEYKSNTSGNSKVIFTNIEDVPRFLSAGNNVKSRTTNFASISTIINLNKKIKIDFYSIFNNTNQHEKFLQNTILNPSFEAIKINEQNNTKEKNYFLALQLKSIYKLNKKTVLTLNNNFNIDNTNQTNSIENNSNNDMKLIKENFTPKKLIFSTSLSLKKNIDQNILSSNLFLNYRKNTISTNISSNKQFLNLDFDNDYYSINQSFSKKAKEIGFDLNYTINKKNISISFFSNTSLTNNKLVSNTNNQVGFNNNLKLTNLFNSTGTDVIYKINKTINFYAGFNYNYIFNKYNTLSNKSNYLGVKSSIKAVFNSNNIGQLSYNYSNSVPTIDNLLNKAIVKNYRNLIINEDVNFSHLFPFHQFNLSHFIFKPKSKFSFIFNSSLNIKNKSINNNILNSINLTLSKSKIINQDNMFTTFFFVDKELKNIPFSISGSMSYNTSKTNYFQNNIKSQFKNQNVSSFVQLKSKFKNSKIHFDFGYKLSKDLFKNNKIKSSLSITKTYLNLNGQLSKELFWNLNSVYAFYKTLNNKRNLYSLNPKLRYSKKNSDWEFSFTGNNILNLKNQSIIENSSNPSFFEQRATSILNGYLIFGAKLKF